MTDDINPNELSREDAIVAREAIANLLVNNWSAMDRDALKDTEAALARSIGRDPEFRDPAEGETCADGGQRADGGGLPTCEVNHGP